MSGIVVRVVVPVVKTKTSLTLYKGKPWSVVEHLLLEAIASSSKSRGDLQDGFRLPRPILAAALMRLMQSQWIQVHASPDSEIVFAITRNGRQALSKAELPFNPLTIKTERVYLYERITGHVFRTNELPHFNRGAELPSNDDSVVVVADEVLPEGHYRVEEVDDVLLEGDEMLVGVQPIAEHYSDKFAQFQVVNGSIVDWPVERQLPDLQTRILRVAQEAVARSRDQRNPIAEIFEPYRTHAINPQNICFRAEDLIIGGPGHKVAIEQALLSARSRVVIHSTFLGLESIESLLKHFASVRPGVRIDVLWGQDEKEEDAEAKQKRKSNRERLTASQIIKILQVDARVVALGRSLRFHVQSTRSHAKAIIFDPIREGQYVALIGSCNWLASGYNSVEASIVLRSTPIVREALQCLARAVHAGAGVRTEMYDLLSLMARSLPNEPSSSTPNATAALIVNDAHNDCMLRAGDEAKRRVLLTSHRLGAIARPGAFVPLARACGKEGMDARIYYGRLQGIRNRQAAQWTQDCGQQGMHLEEIENPRIHAKLFAWDDDTVVVTSQNWLSADPRESHIVKELGVMIDAPGIGALAIQRFDECMALAD